MDIKNKKFNEINIDEMQNINGGSIGRLNPYINYDEIVNKINEILTPLHFTYGSIISNNIKNK